MPLAAFTDRNRALIDGLTASGQLKTFYEVEGPLSATARIGGREVIVLCSNNYLGLADDPAVIAAGHRGLDEFGAGTASVRFICGTLACHRDLERAVADLVGTEDALSYVSCWMANEAVFPTLTAPGDVLLSDELNHASIIDGCRLTSKQVVRAVYRHGDLADLEEQLRQHAAAPCRFVVTDGVFSMEGDVARLPELVDLCRRYGAVLIVDDSHGVGVLGPEGRGTPDHFGLLGQVDILTGTLGKALGGAAGGYVAAGRDVLDVLQQRGRPSLFSNALPATVARSAGKAIEILRTDPARLARLKANVATLRKGLAGLGFDLHDSPTAIIPIMVGDEAEAIHRSRRLMDLGVMVIGFGFPVVPRGQARLRVQVSAALTDAHLETVLDAFSKL